MTQPPKPRVEVREETHETLHVLDLDRTPREEKLRREAAFEKDADEVRYVERAWRPRRDDALDAIRAAVDAMEERRPSRLPPEPEPPAAEPVRVPVRLADHHRGPLARLVEGEILGVETVHRLGTSTVVEARWRDPAGEERRQLFVVRGGEARPYDDVAARIDALPTPALPEPAPAPVEDPPATTATPTAPEAPAAAAASEKPAEPAKKPRFGLGRKKDAPAKPAAPEPAQAPGEEPKKRRFGLGRK